MEIFEKKVTEVCLKTLPGVGYERIINKLVTKLHFNLKKNNNSSK